MNKIIRNLIVIVGLLFATITSAALYNIVGTDDFVNGKPANLNTRESAKLATTTIAKTDAAITAGKYNPVTTTQAKAKIKAIIASEVCPSTTTGTWPNCVPKVCEEPTEGTYPNCVQKTCKEPTEGIYPACTPKACIAPEVGTYPACALPPPPIGGQTGLMPTVDVSKNMTPAIGSSTLNVKPTTEVPPNTGGAFRIVCAPSHMNNDDPIVYPGQLGRAHHHTFFGNTNIDYKTNVVTISEQGNSTCKGGIMNRSSYWVPSMINTVTNAPILPDETIFYYKKHLRIPFSVPVSVPPKGLRMIAGNMFAKTATESKALFTCQPPSGSGQVMTGWHKSIQNCALGWDMQMTVSFPMCWDGVNLDSPDHQSHMAYNSNTNTSANKCPATHPVALPHVEVNFKYKSTTATDFTKWRLSSDNYDKSLPAGYSSHSDWINGWNQTFLEGIVANCLNKNVDCHAHLLGDGRMFN